jgi:tetratricopeptide (TPR) repeat protein
MEMGRHDEAIAALHRYIELAPADPNVYDSLGMAYQWAGRYPEAIATFEKALSLNPQFEIAVIHLANTYVWLGRYQEAMRQYQRFIQVASFDAYRSRGYVSVSALHIKKKEFAEAERAARAAFRYDKKNVVALLALALERGDLATAEKLKAIYEVNRGSDRGNRGYERSHVYFRGYLALKGGRADDAVEHFKASLRHRPMQWNIDAYEDCLANAYLEMGRSDEAISEYERILRLNPNYPLAHYHLAQAYEQKGEREKARAAYERFLEIWKDADLDIPEVTAARERLK